MTTATLPSPDSGTGGSRFGLRLRAWYLLPLLLVALAAHVAVTGVWVVKQNEQGVVLRFGRVRSILPAGMHFILPYPLETMRLVRTTEVRTMSVGFSYEQEEELDAAAMEEEVQWLTGDTNIVEMQTAIQYIIKSPVDYLFRVADFSDGQPRDVALRKAAESVLTFLVARMKVDDVLSSGKARIQEESRRLLQELVDAMRLGVQVVSVNIVEDNPPPNVIAAFNDVSSAKADRQRLMNVADGYAKDLLPRARARAHRIRQEAEIYRSEVVNEARGGAQRFLKLAEQVRTSPQISKERMWLEMIEKTLSRARMIVYPRKPGRTFTLTHVEGKIR
jgi:membrane protease subunit HflK